MQVVKHVVSLSNWYFQGTLMHARSFLEYREVLINMGISFHHCWGSTKGRMDGMSAVTSTDQIGEHSSLTRGAYWQHTRTYLRTLELLVYVLYLSRKLHVSIRFLAPCWTYSNTSVSHQTTAWIPEHTDRTAKAKHRRS